MTAAGRYIYLIVLCTFFVASCSSSKLIPKGDSLFLGGSAKIMDKENTPRREIGVLQSDLSGAIRPKPNTSFLGMRWKLSIYAAAGDTSKKSGFRKWIRSIGEAPVLTSAFDSVTNKKLLINILENKGYFYPQIAGSTKTVKGKTRASFEVTTGQQYKIRDVHFPADSSKLASDIRAQQEATLLKKDAPYNLDLIKGEFDRIDKRLKELGYYYFTPDHLITRVDSTIGDHKVDVYLMTEYDMPPEAKEVYSINRVYIYPNYRIGTRDRRRVDTTTTETGRRRNNDTLFYERYYIVGNTKTYKPFIFTQAMQFWPGDLYNRTDQNMALNRLVNMGTFKFVKNSFEDIGNNQLNTYYYLTPYPKKSFRLEIGAYTKNDSRLGSQASISWRNRNAFRGGELFAMKLSGAIEKQYGGNVTRPGIYQLGLEPSFTIPRFIIPFYKPRVSTIFVPKTRIIAGYDLQLRDTLYNLQSVRASYGYEWKSSLRTDHQFYPVNVVSVRTDTLTDDDFTINYNNLIFDGLIVGPTYAFTYSTRATGIPNRQDFYFNGLVDLSGNIFGVLQGSSLSETQKGNPKTIFGQAYAQYVKFQTDIRYYRNYNAAPSSIWANRMIIGVGVPYGNSTILPNVKQFYSGGNSSLRGFPSRLVGPGTFNFRTSEVQYIETSGDLKLELNTELRGKLYSFIHGALFVDAGNIWTLRDTTLFGPEAKFSSKFMSQLAASVGAGIRFDLQIMVLRFDFGIPVRKPWLLDEGRSPWDFAFNFGDPDWRKQNLILNIGIGYPF